MPQVILMDEEKFEVGIKALIVNEMNQVLVMFSTTIGSNHNIPHWDLPGGRIKQDHSIEETLQREILEELGVDGIEVIEQLDAGISKIPTKADGIDMRRIFIIYECKLPQGSKIILSDEHSEYRWVSIDEAKELLKLKFADSLIEKLDSLNKFKDIN